MPFGSCYGEEQRLRIAREYTVTPLHHMHAPGEMGIQSCSGRRVETYFYVLEYQDKRTGSDHGTVFAGRYCAQALLDLLKLPHLKPAILFSEREPSEAQNGSPSFSMLGHTRSKPVQLTPLNEELTDILNVLVYQALPDRPLPEGPIARLLRDVRKSPQTDLRDADIKALNSTVRIFTKGDARGVMAIADHLAKTYGHAVPVRTFPKIHEVLARRKLADNINSSLNTA